MASAPATQPETQSLDDFYVPAYRVLIRGKEQPHLEQDIVSITYSDSLTNVDSVDLVVNNWDPGDPVKNPRVNGSFRYSDSHVFDPWQDIEVSMGYYRKGQDQRQLMMIGEIVTMAPNFPASGGSTLTVRALNFLHQFRTQQKTLTFKGKTDSQIAQAIVEDINKDLKKKLPKIQLQMDQKEIDENIKNNKEKPHEFVEMHHQFPIVFLMQRARDIGYDLNLPAEDDKVDKSGTRVITFHYRSSATVVRRVYTLEWGNSLISFQPTLQTARQVNAVTVRGWNVQTKKAIEETATRADLAKDKERVVAPEDLGVSENSLSQKLEIVVDRGFKNAEDAKRVAKKTLRQLAQGLVEAKGKTIGLPDLRAGSRVRITFPQMPSRAASRFEGIYQVTSTTHTIGDGGYTTDFAARMEERLEGGKQP